MSILSLIIETSSSGEAAALGDRTDLVVGVGNDGSARDVGTSEVATHGESRSFALHRRIGGDGWGTSENQWLSLNEWRESNNAKR